MRLVSRVNLNRYTDQSILVAVLDEDELTNPTGSIFRQQQGRWMVGSDEDHFTGKIAWEAPTPQAPLYNQPIARSGNVLYQPTTVVLGEIGDAGVGGFVLLGVVLGWLLAGK